MEENQDLHLITLVVTIYGDQQLMCVCVSTCAVCMRVCDNGIYGICAVHSCLTLIMVCSYGESVNNSLWEFTLYT